MATGIQTGMRTGSGPLATGRGPLGKPPGGGGGGLGKFGAMWAGLNPKVRVLIICAIGLLIGGGLLFAMVSSANKPVELSPTKMSEADVTDVSAKLTEWNIPHTVSITNDNILVQPSMKVSAQARLMQHGLPRHSVMTAETAPQPGGMNTMTDKEKAAVQKRILEGELTMAMREMEGISDARVNLGLPERTLFDEGQEAAKAAVMLKMKPGARLTRDQITGIVNWVSASVPDLKPEQVTIVDTQGRDLTAGIPLNGGEMGMAPSSQLEYQSAKEKELQRKVEQQLASILGSDQRFSAQVTAEIDFSQNETNREIVGGPSDNGKVTVGTQTRSETYNKDGKTDSGDGAVQMSSSSASSKGGYAKVEQSTKVEVNKTVTRNVDTSPRIERLTVAVAVDNLKKDQVDAIAGLVKDAIGINEGRGDSVTVKSMPFASESLAGIYGDMAEGMANGPAPVATQPLNGVSPQALAALAFVPAVILLALIAVFVTKQRQVQAGQSQLVLGASSGSTSSDIADLLNEKSGKSKAMGETRVNTTDQLEKLAKERPTKVAELLKSTWLNGDR